MKFGENIIITMLVHYTEMRNSDAVSVFSNYVEYVLSIPFFARVKWNNTDTNRYTGPEISTAGILVSWIHYYLILVASVWIILRGRVCVCVCIHACILLLYKWFPVTHKDFVASGGSYISIWEIQNIFWMSNLE
jgi:hypothetical protein